MCSDRSALEEAIAKRRNPKEWRITEIAAGAKMDKEVADDKNKIG